MAAVAGPAPGDLDAQVRAFLDRTRGDWHDMNVPFEDGQALHDLIVKKGFTRGMEIGTSTGHSGVWIAWAIGTVGHSGRGGAALLPPTEGAAARRLCAHEPAAGAARLIS